MDELDDYEGEDWKGWVAGKYDNRYGVRRHNEGYTYSRNKGSKKKKVSFVFVCLIACFCVISISGTVLLNSNDYLDVELSMMFYHNILTGIIYEGEIQKDILSLDKEKIVTYIEDVGTLVKEKLKNKRIEDENRRIQETIERYKAELANKQEMEREYELLIFEYTNNERIKYDLNPLQLNERISNVARLHSQDMLENTFFEHNNLRGQTPTDRGNSLGVSCVKNYVSYYTEGLDENIYHMEGYGVSNVAENSKTIVNDWMGSAGHRENILGRDYDQIGIGVKFSNYEIYATQNFC